MSEKPTADRGRADCGVTALESWRGSLEAMSLDELDELLTDEERGLWFAAIAGRLTDLGEPLTSDLVAVLAGVLATTRRARRR